MKRQTVKSRLAATAAVTVGFIAASALVSHAAPALSAHAAPVQSEAVPANLPRGDPIQGKKLYQSCASCHSIDENDIGPRHRGVVGRRAGSVEDYSYSAALKNSGLTWDQAMLDRWLTNPSALVPGTKMFFKIDDAQTRADIIAYLNQQM